MTKRYNILISANHCAPDQGSEHGVGWNFISQLSRHHNITLITNKHIYYTALLEKTDALGIKVHGIKQYIQYKGLTRFIPFFYYLDYRWWQYRVYKKAVQLHKEIPFDLVHHLTNITFREPGYLWKTGIPFVWGPVVALGNETPKFLSSYGWKDGLKMLLRHVSFKIQYTFSGRIKKALKATNICLPVCEDTRLLLQGLSPETKFCIMPETAAKDECIKEQGTAREEKDEMKILWVSRFDRIKGVMFLLKALELLPPEINYKLILAGDGIQKKEALDFCEKKKLSYEYLGKQPYNEIQKIYASGHVFCLTSLMDATTTVVFEALSNGLPVITTGHLAFGEKIDATCGRKIKPENPEQIVQGFAEAIQFYYFNEDARREASRGALKRAKEHSWNTRIKNLNTIYDEIINSRKL